MTPSHARPAGLLGVTAVLLFVIAFAADPTPPVAGAAGADVVRHALQFSAADRLAGFTFAAGGVLLGAFAAALRPALRATLRDEWVATAMLAGAVAGGTLITATAVLFFAIGSRGATLDPQLAGLLSDVANYGFVFAGFGVLVFVACAVTLMLRARGAMRVLGELGIGACALLVLYLCTAFFSSGPVAAGAVVSIIAFAGATVWFALVALALLLLEPHALGAGASARRRRGANPS